ncbi:alpha/beta hydrolase [Patescibacteria group bacterium]|nr:alpha/beta hydrolase [Patescibacteria group bacterium]MBU1473084.1 alpha/beta hydrolase [Patescibacteria group bacterium]MBU2459621.1 alpha/beta hydrolase [Patescibacteria group bacterium]MBU2544476.1 alpha/beta hydrolase [Patescibacteria group bacterium]
MFIINRFGEKLEALWRRPVGNGPFPVVLFVSGFGMDLHESKNSNDEISNQLLNKGFATLQFSFAGCGRSEGNYTEMTLERQAKQVEDMLTWLRQRGDIDNQRIGIHATSMGVATVLLADFARCASLCFVAGVYNVNRSIHQVYEEERGVKIHHEGTTQLPRGSGATTPVGPVFWKSIAAFNVITLIQKLTLPVFLVHGDQDTKVSTSEVREVFDKIPSKEKRLKIFAGGDHGIIDVPRSMREEFLKEVVNWFRETL